MQDIMRDIRYAIFDADGTLLDSMPAWDGVAAKYLQSLGITPRPELWADMQSIGGHQLPWYFREKYGVDKQPEEIRGAVNSLLADFYHNRAPLKSGALGVLEALYSQGAAMCVATATDRELIEPALRRCGVLPYFRLIFTCGEEGVSKHTPDIYMRAARYLGGRAAETYVFEDAFYAVKTAKHAGFKVVAVYDEAADADWDEARNVAWRCIRSFEDWL